MIKNDINDTINPFGGPVMLRKSIIATVIIFILWSIVDFLLHGLILRSAYADTSQLWRPMEEMSP